MTILLGVAGSRKLNAPYNRIADIKRRYAMDVMILDGHADDRAFYTYPNSMRYNNATAKFEKLRRYALDYNYEALLLIDDDQLVDPDDIQLLLDVDADMVWGLTVWRGRQRRWSACVCSTPHYVNVMLDQLPNYARRVYGGVIDVVGHGNFCTLIRRPALEVGEFKRPRADNDHLNTPMYPGGDWYFSRAVHQNGLRQCCHTGVHVGHIEEERAVVLYPTWTADDQPGVRVESYIEETRRHPW